MKPIILFDHVSFSYAKVPTLKEVSFQIDEGEFVGIFGPNGGGKTTLLKLIMGFLEPDMGNIEVFGKSPQKAQYLIGYVPQRLLFDRQFPISVLEFVLSGRLSRLPWYGRFSQQDRQAALEALEKVDMADHKSRAFGTLSGGQAQRTLIARALVSDPKLLLLDEPTTSVDPQSEKEIYDILKQLQKKMTILMVTHNLRAAVEQVERVLCVQTEVTQLGLDDVCKHFAIGLYHPPLVGEKE